MKQMEITSKAINLFKEKYGKTPKEAGFPVIGIYERKSAFLYAASEEVIKAYKTHQNIIRWVLVWFVWPLGLALINFVVAIAQYHDSMHWRCWISYVFSAVWLAIYFGLYARAWQLGHLIKPGENITLLNY